MSGNQIERLIDNRVRQTGRNEKKESDKERKKRKQGIYLLVFYIMYQKNKRILSVY